MILIHSQRTLFLIWKQKSMVIIGPFHINVRPKRNISIIFNLFRLGEEALGHCLLSATKLALAGKIQTRIFLFDLFLLTQAQPIKINIVLNLWKN
jgi:hypothetical protein